MTALHPDVEHGIGNSSFGGGRWYVLSVTHWLEESAKISRKWKPRVEKFSWKMWGRKLLRQGVETGTTYWGVLKLPAAKDPLPQFRPQSEELLKTPPTTVPAHPSWTSLYSPEPGETSYAHSLSGHQLILYLEFNQSFRGGIWSPWQNYWGRFFRIFLILAPDGDK